MESATYNEVVTLVGEVPSAAFRDFAAKRVAAVPGVRSVENQLTVAQDLAKPRANQAIAKSVEFALVANGFDLAVENGNPPPIEAPKPNSTATIAISAGRIVAFSFKR